MLSARTAGDCDARSVLRRRARLLSFVLRHRDRRARVRDADDGATAATSTVAIGAGLRGPKGLTATVYAKRLKKVSALAVDAQGRVWAATAAATDKGTDAVYLVTEAGATPLKVVTDVHTPLGLLWVGDTLYVSEATGVVALERLRRHRVRDAHHRADRSRRHRRGERHRPGQRRSAVRRHLRPVRLLHADRGVVGIDGLVPPRRLRRAGLRRRHPRRRSGSAFFPGTDDLFVTMNQRDDLGAKTPGDWLAVVRAGQSWGFPGCYGQGGTKCTGVPSPDGRRSTKHAAVSGVAIVTGQLGSTRRAPARSWPSGSPAR